MKYILNLVLFLFGVVCGGVHSRYVNRAIGGAPLIVGGVAAERGQFPYQLIVNISGNLGCGAALVEVDGVQVGLTAAQCVHGSIIQYSLVAGEFDLDTDSGLEQTRDVSRMIVYPSYISRAPYHHDIAILLFDRKFELNEFVQPIPLAETFTATDGNITVAGWGRLWADGPLPNLLHYVDIPVVNNTACAKIWAELVGEIIDGQFCAGENTGSVSTCTGDAGGGVKSEDGNLVGIVSWGWGCGHPQYPGVFTNVSFYIEWIKNIVDQYKRNQLV